MSESKKLGTYTDGLEKGYVNGLYLALSLVEQFKLAFSRGEYLEIKYPGGNMYVSTVKAIPVGTDNVYLDPKGKSAIDVIEWLESLLNARIGVELKKIED